MAGLEVRVLGPTEVVLDGALLELRRRERAVLAALAVRPGPVDADELARRLWDEPPPTATKSLHNHVRRLRATIGVRAVETVPGGYQLHESVHLDLDAAAAVLADAASAAGAGDHDLAAHRHGRAVALRRGTPFSDLRDVPEVVAARSMWEERLAAAELERAASLLRAGNAEAAANELETLVARHAHRERGWLLLALALYRTGRRRDSLRVLRRARTAAASVGLGLARDLAALESRILDDDPALLGRQVEATARRRRGAPRRSASDSLLVGRQRSIDAASQAWRAVQATGLSGWCAIVGEPGVGKTALARRVAAEVSGDGAVVAWGSCDPTPVAPLAPLAAVVSELARAYGRRTVEAWAGDLRPALAVLLDGASATPAAPARLADAAVTAISHASRARPLLLVIDDLQWALPTTRRALDRVVEAGGPLLLLVTCRPGSPLPGAVAAETVIVLEGLPLEEVQELAQHLIGRHPPEALARAVHDRTGGIPLLVRHLLAAVPQDMSDDRLLAEVTSAIPGGTVDAVRHRITDLSASARRAVAAAAVLGRPDRELLDHLLGPCERELEEIEATGLFIEDASGPRFAHEVYREAALASLAPGVRLELHDAAGRAMAELRPEALDQVAHHHLMAASLDPDTARTAALAAARSHVAVHAHGEAAEMFRAALQLVSADEQSTPSWLDVEIDRGECLRLHGDPASREVLLAVAMRALAAEEDARFGRAVLSLCRLGMTTEAGEVDHEVRELAERALAQTSDDAVRSELAAAMSLLLSFDGNPARCRSMFQGAVSTARSLGDPGLLGRVLPFAYLALGRREDLEERSTIARELVALGSAGDDLAHFEGLHLRFAARIQSGRSGWERDLDRMRVLTERLDDVGRTWAVGYCSAVAAYLDGDLDESEAVNDATLAVATSGIAASRAMAVYGAQLLAVRAEQGRLAELVPMLAPLVDDQPGVPAWRAALAGAAAAAGDEGTAMEMVDHFVSNGFRNLPDDAVRSAALHQIGAAVVSVGDVRRAPLVYDELLAWTGCMSWAGTCTLGAVDQVLGELAAVAGRTSVAARHLRRAARIGGRLPAPRILDRATRTLAALG